ncbi:hypothetical protein ACEWYB_03470 [Helicobacter pylori]|nr:hypothetical protein [Helicobacter pylori]
MAKLNSLRTLLKAIIQTELELFTINIQLSHHAKMGFILRH